MLEFITNPAKLYSRTDVYSGPCPVPAESGIYGWFFKNNLPSVPLDGCESKDGKTLLYVGASLNLRQRIKQHFTGSADRSTLRLVLGVLLTEQSDYPLRIVEKKTKTFTNCGECWLDRWMKDNAFVCWMPHAEYRDVESSIIKAVSLPLNIKGNDNHGFVKTLKSLRAKAMDHARAIHRNE